jgi:hypothetical protein
MNAKELLENAKKNDPRFKDFEIKPCKTDWSFLLTALHWDEKDNNLEPEQSVEQITEAINNELLERKLKKQ